MTSRATVRRRSGYSTVDGFDVPSWSVVYADLPLRVAGAVRGNAPSRLVDAGGVRVEVGVRVAHFPHDAAALADGDLVEVTSGDCAGLVFRVVEVAWQDQATSRRVPVVTVERPGEWV